MALIKKTIGKKIAQETKVFIHSRQLATILQAL
jgi:hypothetical protein